jgi:hypothetical protein
MGGQGQARTKDNPMNDSQDRHDTDADDEFDSFGNRICYCSGCGSKLYGVGSGKHPDGYCMRAKYGIGGNCDAS